MAQIRIRVGASLDSKAASVFQPLEAAAARARANIDKSLNEAAKAPGRVAKATMTSGDAMIREVEAMGEKMFRDDEKSQNKRTKLVERESKERARLEKQAAAEVKQINDRVQAGIQSDRAKAAHMIGLDSRSVGRGISHGLGTSMRLIRGGASIAGGLAEELLQGVGLDTSLASHMGHAQDFSQRISQVTNAGYIPGAAGAQGQLQNNADVAKDVKAAANASAFDYNETAEGLQKFVGLTGDLATGRSILKSTGELARATGADFVSMSEASAEVANHLGNVPDKAAAVESVMRVIAGQGKMGALEIKDFARQMAKIAANAPKFEGSISDTIGELGLIAQESKMGGGSASASQAATSVLAFSRDFAKKTTFKNWAAAGLSPFTDKTNTKLRRPEELILEAVKYTKGDQKKLTQLFPSQMAVRAVNPFAAIYAEKKGTDRDKELAVIAEFERMRHAQLDETEVLRAHAQAMSENKSKIQLANNKLDDMAGDINNALRPAIAGLVPALEQLLPVVTGLVSTFANMLGDVTGANQKGVEGAADSATGKLSEDERLLESTKRTQFVPGKGMVPVYSPEALETIRLHGKDRSAALGGLEGQIGKKQEEAADFESQAKLDLFGVNAKASHALGGESFADKAARDRSEIAHMIEQQKRATDEAARSNELLARVETAILLGNAKRAEREPPKPTPGGAAPAESEP